MATVQTPQEMKLPSTIQSQDDTDLLTFTMAAIRLVNPWSEKWVETTIPEDPRERVITLAEVSAHDSPRDCWVVIYDRVYDITTFLDEHPGGCEIMLEYAGSDASTSFRGSGHSRSAMRALDRFLVGELPMHERLYRRPGGIRLSDMPE